MKNFLKKWYPLLIILTPALFLRIYLLLHRGTFWFDENFSIHFSMLASWSDTIKYWVLETNPPFYMLFLKAYLPFVNENNEILVRLPSVIFSILSIVLLYIFAENLFSRRAAIVSTSLLTISTLNLFISAEARVYSLLTFLTILSFYLFHKLVFEEQINNQKNSRLWILYFFVNLFILYSHLTGAVILVCQLISIGILKPNRKIFLNWFKLNFLAGALYLVWFIPSIYNKLNLKLGTAWYFETSGDILNLLFAPVFNTIVTGFQETLFFIIFILIMHLLIQEIKNSNQKKEIILISLWALLPPLLSALLGVYVLKYIVIAYPGIYLFFAYFLDKYIKNKKLFVSIFIIFLFLSIPHTYQLVSKPIFSWSDITNYIEENENENSITMVPFMEVLSINKYYKGNRPVIGVYVYDDNLSLEERIVRYNWNLLQITDEELKSWLFTKIEQACASTVYVVHPPNSFEKVNETFLEVGWILTEIRKPNGLTLNNLYIFDAPDNYTTPPSCK